MGLDGPLYRVVVALSLVLAGARLAPAQGAKAAAGEQPGQFFTIEQPITDQVTRDFQLAVSTYLTRMSTGQAQAGAGALRPILVIEFRPGSDDPQSRTSFGAAADLADLIAHKLAGARKTVAYVPESLSGFAIMPVLACDEIVLGPNAELGPVMLDGVASTEREQAAVRQLAKTKGREVDLLLGMLDPALDLREVRTPEATHFVLADRLEEFKKEQNVTEEKSAWDARRGVLTAEHARRTIAQLLAADRSEIAAVYKLPSTAFDPTLTAQANALRIPIHGPITTLSESYILRQLARAKAEGTNLIFFDIDSAGGLFEESSKIATAIAEMQGVRTIGYIDDRALGMAALIPLGCDEIVLKRGARFGEMTQQIVDSGGRTEALDDRLIAVLSDQAEALARKKGHPPAVARAMVDPEAIVHLARDKETGAAAFVLDTEVKANPGRYDILETPKSDPANVLTFNDQTALKFQLADRAVGTFDELAASHGVKPETLREAQRTWVDSMVDTLNEPWLKGLLLFLGFFLLMLEVKLPGVGLPAILAALCFLLYFWSNYLGGTADQLEILLFIGGLICLGLELFVFPGFGVFGMSGVLLILVSVVMASHTFALPTRDYEYRELAWSLLRILGVLGGGLAGIALLSRYLPSIPLFNRLVLKPHHEVELDVIDKPDLDDGAPYTYLLGERGRTTTVLRPSGKARFGEALVDVTAEGYYIEADQAIEVVEVRGARVLVKRV